MPTNPDKMVNLALAPGKPPVPILKAPGYDTLPSILAGQDGALAAGKAAAGPAPTQMGNYGGKPKPPTK
jgi:hypothetical protein